MRFVYFVLGAGLLFTQFNLSGQTLPAQASQRADLFSPANPFQRDPYDRVVGPDSVHAETSPNDPDLGEQAILKRQEHYRAFTLTLTTPIYYTSNVALSRRGEQGDLIFAPLAGIAYTPRWTRTLYGVFSVQQQQFLYDDFDGLDFGSFDTRAGVTYVIVGARELTLRGEYHYNRLTSDDFDEFFSEHSLFLNAELPLPISRAQRMSVGAVAELSFAGGPDDARRHDFEGYVVYAVDLTRSLNVTAAGRIALREYVSGGRTDVSEIFAVTATYRFTKWLSAAATAMAAASQSNQSVFDYEVVNIGAAVALTCKF